MKKTKAILCIALSMLLVFLCGCSFLEQKEGFIKMTDLIINKDEHISSSDINGDTAVLFTLFTDGKEDKSEFRIVVYNMRWNKIKADKIVTEDANYEDSYTVEFVDDKRVALCDVWENKATFYDLDLNILEKNVDYKAKSEIDYTQLLEKYKEKSKFVTDDFVTYEKYASNICGTTRAIIMEDDPNNVYIEEYSPDVNAETAIGNLMAYSEETKNTYSISIKDYSTKTVINTASFNFETPSPEDFSRVPYGVNISEKYIIIPYNDVKGNLEGCCYWNYTINQTSTPFDILTLNTNNISKEVEKAKTDIENKYDIEFVINPDKVNDDRPLIKEDNELIIYQSILFIDHQLSYFPEGMLKEIYDYDGGFDTLRIYLCGRIVDDNIQAFANNLNGINYVVFQTKSLSSDVVPHELMHAMEYRIWHEIGDKHDEELLELNPEGFDYVGTDSYFANNYEYNYDDGELRYFARDYGITDQLEDKAVTFEALFCYGINDMTLEWKKTDPVYKKAKILCKAIRNAYPSVQKADSVVWEKFLNEE